MWRKKLTYWMILFNPGFLGLYGLGLRYLYLLCQYGGLRRFLPWILGCGFLGIVWIIFWTIFYFYQRRKSREGSEEPGRSSSARKIWIFVLAAELVALAGITGYYGVKIGESAVPYQGKLSWKLQEWRDSRKVRLVHDNIYETGISGILADLERKVDLPSDAYIINPFTLTFDQDGTIQEFYCFFYGRDGAGEEHTYLLDYNGARDDRMTVWLDHAGERDHYPSKRLSPMIEVFDVARLEALTNIGENEGDDLSYTISYSGYTPVTDPDRTLVYNASGQVMAEGLQGRQEAYLTELKVYSGEEMLAQIWLANGWRLADTTEEKAKKEEEAREALKEIGSCYMDRADESWYFYLNDSKGWRLRVQDAAAGSRYYVMDVTEDGGDSWQEWNEAPFGDQIGVTRGILFFDDQYGYISLGNASGETAGLYVTRDGGKSFGQVLLPWDQVTDTADSQEAYQYLFLPEETQEGLCITAAKDSSGQGDRLVFVSEDQGNTWKYVGRREMAG